MGPTSVNLSTQNIAKLNALYSEAKKQITAEMEGATDFGIANRQAILNQIDAILRDIGAQGSQIIKDDITTQYQKGANQAVSQLNQLGADVNVSTGFNDIHQAAVQALVDDTQRAFATSLTAVKRQSEDLLSNAVKSQLTQEMAIGTIGGQALKDIKNNLVGALKNDGITGLVDKSGRAWELDTYSEMLIRTKAVEARNTGLANRMAENDYDLVQVSSHGASDACQDWEGEILSLTGATDGYPTVDEAEGDGLFHPNCEHALNALLPDLAIQTSAYDSESGDYLDSVQKQLDDKLAAANTFQPAFIDKIQSIASANNLTSSIGPVKTNDRAIQKIVTDYSLKVDRLKDVNRGAIFISDPSNVQSVIDSVGTKFDITRVKNDLTTPTPGYKKAIINVTTPAGVGEIQITTPEYWAAKKDLGGDIMYDQVRVKVAGWEAIEVKMNALYDSAAKAVEARLNSS